MQVAAHDGLIWNSLTAARVCRCDLKCWWSGRHVNRLLSLLVDALPRGGAHARLGCTGALAVLTACAQLRATGDHRKSVQRMLEYAGHTICISSVTLIICFMGMFFYPAVTMVALGACCAIAVFTTLIVNLSLTPLLLLTFGAFFESGARADVCARCSCRGSPHAAGESRGLLAASNEAVREARLKAGCWYRAGQAIVKPACGAVTLLVVFACCAPLAYYSFGNKLVDDILCAFSMLVTCLFVCLFLHVCLFVCFWRRTQRERPPARDVCACRGRAVDLPRHHPATDVYIQMADVFGYGTMYPYRVLFTPNSSTPLASQEFFDMACGSIRAFLRDVPRVYPSDFEGVMWSSGECQVRSAGSLRGLPREVT